MSKSPQQKRRATWTAMMLVGTCFAGTCEVRVRDALVEGTQNFVLNTLLNPANFIITPASGAANDGG